MNDNIHFSSKSNEWETPKFIFDKLNEEFDVIFKPDQHLLTKYVDFS